MKILTVPWKNELLQFVADSRTSIKITSPFVKTNVCNEIFGVKQQQAQFELITTFKLANIYNGSLDLAAIETVLANGGTVKNHSRLHSKIYLFDQQKAVITSSNLTSGGLLKNFEYGVLITDKTSVTQICQDFAALSNDENTGTIKQTDLAMAASILAGLPKNQSLKMPPFELETPEQTFDVLEASAENIAANLSGWRRDVFDAVNNIAVEQFTLPDVYQCEAELQAKHPTNNNVRDKIRQQLQQLRDLGLIEFLGAGSYRKLWR